MTDCCVLSMNRSSPASELAMVRRRARVSLTTEKPWRRGRVVDKHDGDVRPEDHPVKCQLVDEVGPIVQAINKHPQYAEKELERGYLASLTRCDSTRPR